MLYREMIEICRKIDKKTQEYNLWQNVEFSNVKHEGT